MGTTQYPSGYLALQLTSALWLAAPESCAQIHTIRTIYAYADNTSCAFALLGPIPLGLRKALKRPAGSICPRRLVLGMILKLPSILIHARNILQGFSAAHAHALQQWKQCHVTDLETSGLSTANRGFLCQEAEPTQHRLRLGRAGARVDCSVLLRVHVITSRTRVVYFL